MKKDVPKRTAADAAHTVVKAGLSAVPYVGGPVAELFALIIAPPLEKRQKEWLEELADRVRKLEAKTGVTPEQLRDNPDFIDAVLTASQAAIRTSNREKREALRNAIVNSVLTTAPPPDIQQFYLSIIDGLSPWHLRLLTLFQDPVTWFRRKGKPFPSVSTGPLEVVVRHAYPETTNIDVRPVWRDLYNRGLVNTEELAMTMTGSGLTEVRTSPLGGQIVDFTLNHLEDESAG